MKQRVKKDSKQPKSCIEQKRMRMTHTKQGKRAGRTKNYQKSLFQQYIMKRSPVRERERQGEKRIQIIL